MANDWRRPNRKPALESIQQIHINRSGIADYLRRKYENSAPDTTDILETIETSAGIDVQIKATPCNYGGFRFWLVCRNCKGHRLILRKIDKEPYTGFYCNNCLSGVHRITQMSKSDRRFNRRANIRERLGLERRHGLRDRIREWNKPKGMHWNTFYPLMWKHNHLLDIDLKKWIGTSVRLFESWGVDTDCLYELDYFNP